MFDTTDTSGDIATGLQDAIESASSSPETQPQTTEQADPSTTATAARSESAAKDEYGALPFERHHAILENTRRGYEDKLSRVAWAEGLTRSEVEEALALRRELKTRATRSQEPQPDVKDERGDPYYSPQQAGRWAKWQAEQIVNERMQELEERIAPFEEERRIGGIEHDLATAKEWPGFNDHIVQITALITERNNQRERDPRIPKMSLYEAYVRAGAPQKAAADADAKVTARLADEKKKWANELNNTTERVQDAVNPTRTPASNRRKNGEYTMAEAWRETMAEQKGA